MMYVLLPHWKTDSDGAEKGSIKSELIYALLQILVIISKIVDKHEKSN